MEKQNIFALLTFFCDFRSNLYEASNLKDDLSDISSACPKFKASLPLSHTGISLDADGNVWKEAEEDLCSLDYLQPPLDCRLRRSELLG